MARACKFFSLALLGITLSGSVLALGLGDITLNSGLNQRLEAEIEIVGAMPGDLDALEAQLAPRDLFAQYGIDYPQFLTGLSFSVGSDARGNPVLRVGSSQAITEPFVTFLVEANWSRGRLLREYTVLLDPPAFLPGQADTAVAPARTGEAPGNALNRGEVQRSGSTGRTPVQPARSSSARAGTGGGGGGSDIAPGGEYGPVASGESLWKIAARARPGDASLMQTMLAIYQENPQAFYGNMNLLRQGATLRIPTADTIRAVSSGRATATLVEDTERWRDGTATAGPSSGSAGGRAAASGDAVSPQLTLAEPGSAVAGDAGATAAAEAQTAQLRDSNARLAEQVRAQAQELEEARERLAIRDERIAELQRQLAELSSASPGAAAAVGDDATAGQTSPGTDLAPVEDGGLAGAGDEPTATDMADDAGDAAPASASDTSSEAQTAQTPAPVTDRLPPVVTPPQPQGGGLLGTIFGLLTSPILWLTIGGLAIVGAGAIVLRNRAASSEEPLDEFDPFPEEDNALKATMSTSASTPLAAPPTQTQSFPTTVETAYNADDLISGDGLGDEDATARVPMRPDITQAMEPVGMAGDSDAGDGGDAVQLLDEGNDPVSEADFHMAYGLYDQAADLINQALAAEPNRTDLQSKLLEIYFVWGNQEAFREAAGRLKPSLSAVGGAWEKIVIMGKQICPDDDLFAGETTGAGSADLDLGGGEGLSFGDLQLDGDDTSAEEVLDIGLDELPADGEDSGDALGLGLDLPLETTGSFDLGPDSDTSSESPSIADDEDALEFDLELPPPLPEEDSKDRGEDTTLTDMGAMAGFSEDDDSDDTLLSEALNPAMPEEELETDEELTAIARKLEERMGSPSHDEFDLSLDLGQTIAPEAPPETSVRLDLDDAQDDGFGDFSVFTGVVEDEETGPTVEAGTLDDEPLLGSGEFKIDLSDDEIADVDVSSAGGDVTGEGLVLDDVPAEDATLELPETTKLSFGEETQEGLMLASVQPGDDDDSSDTALIAPSDMVGVVNPADPTVESPLIDSDTSHSALDPTVQAPMAPEVSPTAETVSAQVLELRASGAGGDEDTAEVPADQFVFPDADDSVIDEVGTKLDLARAYIDMGDAQSARSILEEVAQEGSAEQRDEANSLLSSLG